jgi:outer membrane protein OmpA-like peptidoglycan-associated protein
LLEIFWKEAIIASGGSMPEGFDTGAFGNTAPENASESLTAAKLQEICFSATLDESQGFEFQPDTARFVNDTLARAGARSISQSILESQCAGTRIRVTGFTASGTSRADFEADGSVDQALSESRAQAFANLLIDEGILVTDVVGGGKGDLVDWNQDGSFNNELGKLNRVVKIEEIR